METQYSIYRIYIGVGLLLLLLTTTPATPAATATSELCAELTTDCIILFLLALLALICKKN
jgi:hypothetical protein